MSLAWLSDVPPIVVAGALLLAIYGGLAPVALPGGRVSYQTLNATTLALFLVVGPSALVLLAASGAVVALALLVTRAPRARLRELAIYLPSVAAGLGVGHGLARALDSVYPLPVHTFGRCVLAFVILLAAFAAQTAARELLSSSTRPPLERVTPVDVLEYRAPAYLFAATIGGPLVYLSLLVHATAGWYAWLFAIALILLTRVWFPIQLHRAQRIRVLLADLTVRERAAALAEVTTRVAHQLRHQLGLIGLSLHRIQARGVDDAVVREELANLGQAQDELRSLLAGDLHGASSESPALGWDEVVRGPLGRIALLARERRVRIDADVGDLPAEPPRDPRKLAQAWFNLLENAVSAARTTVEVRAYHAEGRALLEVRDDGPGMTDEVLAHAAEPFFTTKPDGTGMGLAIAHAVAEEHGGELRFTRATGRFVVAIVVPDRGPTDPRE